LAVDTLLLLIGNLSSGMEPLKTRAIIFSLLFDKHF